MSDAVVGSRRSNSQKEKCEDSSTWHHLHLHYLNKKWRDQVVAEDIAELLTLAIVI
jgi:hypothetical protein